MEDKVESKERGIIQVLALNAELRMTRSVGLRDKKVAGVK